MRHSSLGVLMLTAVVGLAAAQTPSGPITFERIQNSNREPQNWLTYSGNNMGQRYSLLTQITPQNAKDLEMAWLWQARSVEKFEATSIVVDGILYTVQAPNDVVALDAKTGRPIWTYQYRNLPEARNCCGQVNRGLAILGETLFMGTLDAHIIALDAKSGDLLWKTKVADAKDRYAITHAPLVVKDKVIVGTAGGDGGAPGIIAAFDAKTGSEVWRFNTIPKPGEPGNETWSGDSWKRGGAAVWNTGAYDPESNLTYWGTGNPAPDWDGRQRLGDNLYSDCVVALDADTGKLKWFYQFTPHDEMDYDATQVPVLADLQLARQIRTKPASQGHALGQPQWADVCAGSNQRAVPDGQAVCEGELDGRLRRQGPAEASTGHGAFEGRDVDHADCERWDELVSAVVQSQHRAVLYSRLGEHGQHRDRGWPAANCRRHTGGRTESSGAKQKTRRGRLRIRPCVRHEDRRQEVGIQDERRHLCGRADHGVGCSVQRRARGIFLCVECSHRRTALAQLRSAGK